MHPSLQKNPCKDCSVHHDLAGLRPPTKNTMEHYFASVESSNLGTNQA